MTVGPLQFEGRLLAEASSAAPFKKRWCEYALLAQGEHYVIVGLGRSVVPGERDLRWAKTCTLLELLPALSRNGRGPTVAGRELLRRAALVDERIRALVGS